MIDFQSFRMNACVLDALIRMANADSYIVQKCTPVPLSNVPALTKAPGTGAPRARAPKPGLAVLPSPPRGRGIEGEGDEHHWQMDVPLAGAHGEGELFNSNWPQTPLIQVHFKLLKVNPTQSNIFGPLSPLPLFLQLKTSKLLPCMDLPIRPASKKCEFSTRKNMKNVPAILGDAQSFSIASLFFYAKIVL